MTRSVNSDRRVSQVVIGATVLIALGLLVSTVLIGYHYLPGIWGEWIGSMVGIMTTPFFLEASFIVIGFTIVLMFNIYRRNKDGDELVYLEQVDGVEGSELPEHAKWVVYKERPLDGEEPGWLDQLEGAAAAEDWDEVAGILSDVSSESLRLPGVLEVRIALANATGRLDRAQQLQEELKAVLEAGS